MTRAINIFVIYVVVVQMLGDFCCELKLFMTQIDKIYGQLYIWGSDL